MDSISLNLSLFLPMIILIGIGYILKRYKIINNTYEEASSKIVFNLALPATLFYNTSKSNITIYKIKELRLFIISITLMIIAMCIISYLLSLIVVTNKKTKGSFIQGAFRSNYIIFGYPILLNLYGDSIVLVMTIMTAILVPLSNIFAVVFLTMNNPKTDELNLKSIITNVFKNPLIASIAIGLTFSYLGIKMPEFINNTIIYIKGLTTPLALINIGSMFMIGVNMRNKISQMICVLLKTAIYPLVFTIAAILLGFRNEELAVILVACASPSPPSAYIMSKIMNSDDIFAANQVVLTTIISGFTIIFGLWILKHLSYILI